MRISDLLDEKQPALSFEFFPPPMALAAAVAEREGWKTRQHPCPRALLVVTSRRWLEIALEHPRHVFGGKCMFVHFRGKTMKTWRLLAVSVCLGAVSVQASADRESARDKGIDPPRVQAAPEFDRPPEGLLGTLAIRPNSDCARACREQAEVIYHQCREAGGTARECAADALSFYEGCVREQCGEEPDCRVHCAQEAEQAYNDCIGQGGTREECAPVARDVLQACLAEQCGEPPDCKTQCRQEAEQVYQDCLDQGGSEEVCAAATRDYLKQCLADRCGMVPDCRMQCARRAHAAYRDCLKQGGTQEICAARAFTLYVTCLEEQCGEPMDCETRCKIGGVRLFLDCRENGGSIEECATALVEFLMVCLAACP